MQNKNVDDFKNNEFKEHCSDYSFIPFIYEKVKRIVVFGDIHGDYDMIIKLLEMSKLAKIVKEKKLSRTNTKKINKKSSRKQKRHLHDSEDNIDISISETITSDEIEYEMEWIGEDTHLVQVGDQIDRCRPNETYTCDNPKAIDPEDDEDSDVKILKSVA